MLKDYLAKNKTIDILTYTNMVKMSRSSAYRELEKFVDDPSSGISTAGRMHYKVYVLAKE